MYKKRFAKWGFQKNSRRLATATSTSATTVSSKSSLSRDLGSVPMSPELSNEDVHMLVFLTSVRTWNLSFYESLQSTDQTSASIRQPWPEQSQEMNFTFKLMVDMLNRGHGSLAGRVARKAFLQFEDMLMVDAPALVWNLLEIMHYMVTLRHSQLLHLLLAHLMALVKRRMPKSHPLLVMLRALRISVASLPDFVSISSHSSPTSSVSPSSLDGSEATTATGSWLFSEPLLSMIERAWTLNAEILFDRFDHGLFQLYLRIHWDTCSIDPPTAIISAAKQWLPHISSQQISKITAQVSQTEDPIQITPFKEDIMLQRLFATPICASPPRNYESLCVSSIEALREHANSVLSKRGAVAGDTTTVLRILAGLVTAKILEEWPTLTDLAETGISMTSRMSRGQAGNLASAVKTTMDLNNGYDGLEAPMDTVERIQFIVALREYADAETNPQAIREMWLLEDALVAAGEYQKALEVKQTAYRRLEKHIQDIPVYLA